MTDPILYRLNALERVVEELIKDVETIRRRPSITVCLKEVLTDVLRRARV